jgi:aspartyl-tRNA synthetase
VKNCGFKVFSEPILSGGSVRAINIKGGAKVFPRKKIDQLTEFVKTYKAKGLAWAKLTDGDMTSSFAKFLSEAELSAVFEAADVKDGDLLLIVGDGDDGVVFASLGALRCECAKRMGIIDKKDYKFLWVTEFPMFEFSEEENRFVAMHHPFTAPMDEDVGLLDSDKAKCRAKAYDIVLNGTELGGGSIRINTPQVQQKMFAALGFTESEANGRFGHLIDAFKFGAPPHGGLAYGLDRLVMLMTGAESIRDVIAFPKVQNASEPMTGCPDAVDVKQLAELEIKLTVDSEQL